MDHLKEGIGLRGYGQRDPLTEYKKEAFDLFQEMVDRVQGRPCVEQLFKVQVPREDAPEPAPRRPRAAPPRRRQERPGGDRVARRRRPTRAAPSRAADGQKVGRNDPCPCGSGKKYKKCCLAQGRLRPSSVRAPTASAGPRVPPHRWWGFFLVDPPTPVLLLDDYAPCYQSVTVMRLRESSCSRLQVVRGPHRRAGPPRHHRIVGPNGCGKSNISDALRWALGEQSPKALRGHRMEDVIFHGSASRKAVGMAEVLLTFSQRRRALRAVERGRPWDGASTATARVEYLLNKTVCRLKDIHDLFAGTGVNPKAYALMEQERLTHILTAKPLERRVFVEEAAGITRYKQQRAETLRASSRRPARTSCACAT